MKQQHYITPLLILLASLTACEHSDMAIQEADDYDYITFAASPERIVSRTNGYEAYNPMQHPSTMGVFGYYDINQYEALTQTVETPNPIYDNDLTTYNATSKTWSSANTKRWNDYKGAKTFDFFACMPHTAATTVTRTATGVYTLSMPYAMPDNAPFIQDTRQAPIICALPEHKEGTSADGKQFTFERVVKMQFDQSLIGYRLLFQLDNRMAAIRQFHIKSVTLSGNIAIGGTLNRTYTLTNGSWTAAKIQWTNLNRQTFATPYTLTAEASQEVKTDNYTQWGDDFYMIPDTQFEPTINVTYDVEFTAEGGSTIVTRKGVTSSIVLNKRNFSTLTAGIPAMIYPIRILIQPRYLYVLADDDAYTGHLLIE